MLKRLVPTRRSIPPPRRSLLLIGRESRPLGRQIVRCAGLLFMTGLFFAWAGIFLLSGAVLLLWASGPVGVLFGVVWHSLRLPIASLPRNK